MQILAADIGGTHTRLACVQDDGENPLRHEKSYVSARYENFTTVLADFLTEYALQGPFDAACFAIAGPILGDCVAVTNLPWHICVNDLQEVLQTGNVILINDFLAVAYAIPELTDNDLVTLQAGKATESTGNINAAVLGAGTGLGAAHLVWQGDHYHALSSETGHAGFAPETSIQERLLSWLHKEHSHVSVEMLLSGRGIYTIYLFLRDECGTPESGVVRRAIQETDPAQVITEHAISGDDPLSVQTLACFIEIYGAVAGDVALHYYPVNAVYLAGGIAPKIGGLLASGAFINAFTNKGLMQANLQALPVKLIISDNPGLAGAIACARQCYMQA